MYLVCIILNVLFTVVNVIFYTFEHLKRRPNSNIF